MMELIGLGIAIAIGFTIVSVAATLFFYAMVALFYAGAWLLGKITGKDYL